MTEKSSRQTSPAETEASLREHLAGQLADAEARLSAALTALRAGASNPTAAAESESRLASLQALRSEVATADLLTLAGLGNAITASVAAARAIVQQVTEAATSPALAIGLKRATAEARQQVTSFLHDYYDRKMFDPYLRFSSPEDEEAYRKREAERCEAIETALARNTPQGTLEATRLSMDQLNDAGAHGADRSPDFQKRHDTLADKQAELERAMPSAPPVTRADPLAEVAPVAIVDPAILASLRQSGARCSTTQECYTAPDTRAATGRVPS